MNFCCCLSLFVRKHSVPIWYRLRNDFVPTEVTSPMQQFINKKHVTNSYRYLAHGGTQKVVASAFRLGFSTVGKIIGEVCEAIWTNMRLEFMPEMTPAKWKAAASKFEEKWHFPHCVGSIDGKHIQVVAPPASGSLYHNYKGHFSIVLMAVVGPDYRFIMIDVGAYGSENDSAIFQRTEFFRLLENGELGLPPAEPVRNSDGTVPIPYYLVGDEAFALKPYMMRPYSRLTVTSDAAKVFNYRLCRARRIVENAFGILANRWRIFHGKIYASPEKVDKIVQATCVLHNYLTTPDDQVTRQVVETPTEIDIRPGILRRLRRSNANRSQQRALDMRNYLAQYFMTENAGEVPWQYASAYVQSKYRLGHDWVTTT